MKKISVLKVLTVLLMAVLVVGVAESTFAATPTIQVQSIENSGGNSSNNVVNNVRNEPVNNIPVNNTPAPVNNTPAPVSNKVLPDAGAKSTAGIVVLIALTSISAIYTYIKVKEYNI